MLCTKYISLLLNYNFNQKISEESNYLAEFNTPEGEPVKYVLLFDIDHCLYYNQDALEAEKRNIKDMEARLMNEWKDNPLNAGVEPLKFSELKTIYKSSRIGMHKFYRKNLTEIMDIDFHDVERYIKKDEELKVLLNSFDLPKYCFTNAFPDKAKGILQKLEIENCFRAVFCAIGRENDLPYWLTKPMSEAYTFVEKYLNLNEKTRIVFFDDTQENIITAQTFNWITYHVTPNQRIGDCLKKFRSEYMNIQPLNSTVFRGNLKNKADNRISARA